MNATTPTVGAAADVDTSPPLTLGDGYASAAPVYTRQGWPIFPLQPRRKGPPPAGYTGRDGVDATSAQLEEWLQQHPVGNIALRVPAGVVGVDVDQYAHKHGGDRLAELEAELGPLPPTWCSSARPAPSGIYWYRIPAGVEMRGDPLPDVELVQRHHRYAVAPPSVHPTTGDRYHWRGPDGVEAALPPRPDDLPELPAAYVDRWRSDATRAAERPPQPPTPAPAGAEPSRAVCEALSNVEWHGGRHDAMTKLTMSLARLESEGHAGATTALELDGPAHAAFAAALNGERDDRAEWQRAVAGAREKVARTEPPKPKPKLDATAYLQACGATPVLEAATATSWEPIDLTAVLAGAEPPAPVVWAHARGHRLLYAGRTHTFQGASESCKSWAAQAAAAEVLSEGGAVLYIDYEDEASSVVARLRALGATPAQMTGQLVYVRPDEALVDRGGLTTAAGLRFAQLVHERPWRLVVLDGVTEAMTTEGLELNDNTDAARFARRIMRPLADAGAAVVGIDHQTKAGDGKRFAIGAQHKLAGLTGAAYGFETQRPIARATGAEPVVGTVKVTVWKDRPGHVRSRSLDGAVGIMRLTAWPDGGMQVELVDPADMGDTGVNVEVAGRILSHLATYDGASGNQLEQALGGNNDTRRAALAWLVGKGWVEVRKEGQAHRHYLTDTGRNEVPTG